MRTLVLWDIDHTLLDIGGLSGEIYAEAYRETTGRILEHRAPMAGRTDRAIISDTLRRHGLAVDEPTIETFAGALAAGFKARADEIRIRGSVLPGAHAALSNLGRRHRVVQSVLTGNMRPIAECKLTAFGMAELVDLEAGAFGMDGVERPGLVALARQRAHARYGQVFTPQTTVLIGDTPHDVDAGRRGGARVVAVATGSSDEAALRAAGAERVLPDLTDTAGVVEAVLSFSSA